MKDINFRKTENSKQGAFKPAKKNCVIVPPAGKSKPKKDKK